MAKESYEKWMEMIEDLKWTQACEHQENFEKAAALAISPFSKSEEESRLCSNGWNLPRKKLLFRIFYLPN